MHGSGFRLIGSLLLLGVFLFVSFFTPALARDKYPDPVMSLPPIQVIDNGQIRNISLPDAYDFHGNACPGATMAFMAVRYGLELLYDDEMPELEDLIIIARAPGGPMDLVDLIVKGNDPSKRTWPPAGITSSADKFFFPVFTKIYHGDGDSEPKRRTMAE